MAHVARTRGTHRRLQPYAWLGASAVTLGLGVAMVGGTAVAFADTGADTSGATETSTASVGAAPATAAAPATKKKAVGRASRAGVANNAAASAASVDRGSATGAPTATSPALVPAPAAAASTAASTRLSRAAKPSVTVPAAARVNTTVVPPAAADPSYNMDSYLPAEPIVPGAHVKLAFQNMADAQVALKQATRGSGKAVAGVAAIVPQLFLNQAQTSLSIWQNSLPMAQQAVSSTVGIPIIHQIADLNLVAVMTLPTQAQIGLGAAALLLPLVNLLGASTAATADLVSSARSNGTVYAVIPVQMKATTEPTVSVRVAGGSASQMLVDTGSSGLITTRDHAGSNLGDPIGGGEITYSGADTVVFHFTTYNAVVDFGGGAVSEPTPVNIIDAPDAQAFEDFLAPAGVTGILGVGANTYGPGRSLPNTALPGELSDGFLLYQNILFGVFGVMVFGPNPLPTRVSVPGAPDAYLQVSVNGGPKQAADGIIDSGGVYGTLPANLIGGGSSVPAGTSIAVYSPDGTLLYSYRTSADTAPTVVPADGLMNTGYAPFQIGPVYINYAADAAPGGIGSTDFSYA